jgi:outer membrane lipoprotein-sorting protein
VLKFSNFQPHVVLDAATFQFKPPAGADVIRQ